MAERRTLDGRVPRTMVLDVNVGLGDGGSELRVLVVTIIVSAERRPHQRIIDVIFSSSLAQHPLPVLSGSNPDPTGCALPSIPVPSEQSTCPHAVTQTDNHPVH